MKIVIFKYNFAFYDVNNVDIVRYLNYNEPWECINMTGLKIRKATAKDVDAINEIFNYAVVYTNYNMRETPRSSEEAHQWYNDHINEDYPIIVAELNSKVVGWASLSHFKAYSGYNITAEVSVYISKEHRHKGIGIRLMTELERLATRFHTLVAVIVDNNTASLSLHSRCGFVPMCTFKEIAFKNGEYMDVTFMTKKLNNN